MKKSFFSISCKLEGANKERALRVINENNIVIENLVSKQNGSVFLFETNAKNQDRITSLLENYSFSVLKQSKVYQMGKNLKRSLASLIVLLICFLSMPVYNMFVWNIKVEGTSTQQSQAIKGALKRSLVKSGALKASVDTSEVNGFVLSNFDEISICSSVIYGTTLVINVQEKIGISHEEYQPVKAKYDGIVESVSITSGTSNVKCGDIVKAGDLLILPHVSRGNTLISCPALGEIEVRSFASFYKKFLLEEEKLVRTGSTFYVNYFTMFKNFVKIKCKKVQFEHFETEVLDKKQVGFIIPISLYRTCVYELKPVTITHNYEAEKEDFLRLFKLETEAKLGDFAINNVTEEISECEGGYNFTLTFEFNCTY